MADENEIAELEEEMEGLKEDIEMDEFSLDHLLSAPDRSFFEGRIQENKQRLKDVRALLGEDDECPAISTPCAPVAACKNFATSWRDRPAKSETCLHVP